MLDGLPRQICPPKYIHWFGNESSESILEAYGIKPKSEKIDKLKPVQCPNCGEPNQTGAKFCFKCRMILSYDDYLQVNEDRVNTDLFKNMGIDKD
jgi:integrase/recombinase XerD